MKYKYTMELLEVWHQAPQLPMNELANIIERTPLEEPEIQQLIREKKEQYKEQNADRILLDLCQRFTTEEQGVDKKENIFHTILAGEPVRQDTLTRLLELFQFDVSGKVEFFKNYGPTYIKLYPNMEPLKTLFFDIANFYNSNQGLAKKSASERQIVFSILLIWLRALGASRGTILREIIRGIKPNIGELSDILKEFGAQYMQVKENGLKKMCLEFFDEICINSNLRSADKLEILYILLQTELSAMEVLDIVQKARLMPERVLNLHSEQEQFLEEKGAIYLQRTYLETTVLANLLINFIWNYLREFNIKDFVQRKQSITFLEVLVDFPSYIDENIAQMAGGLLDIKKFVDACHLISILQTSSSKKMSGGSKGSELTKSTIRELSLALRRLHGERSLSPSVDKVLVTLLAEAMGPCIVTTSRLQQLLQIELFSDPAKNKRWWLDLLEAMSLQIAQVYRNTKEITPLLLYIKVLPCLNDYIEGISDEEQRQFLLQIWDTFLCPTRDPEERTIRTIDKYLKKAAELEIDVLDPRIIQEWDEYIKELGIKIEELLPPPPQLSVLEVFEQFVNLFLLKENSNVDYLAAKKINTLLKEVAKLSKWKNVVNQWKVYKAKYDIDDNELEVEDSALKPPPQAVTKPLSWWKSFLLIRKLRNAIRRKDHNTIKQIWVDYYPILPHYQAQIGEMHWNKFHKIIEDTKSKAQRKAV